MADARVNKRNIKYSEMFNKNDINKFISYDSKTGILKWIDHYHPVHRAALVGKNAGCICKKGYLEVSFLNKKIRCHNVAWYIYHGAWPERYLDHINRIKTDNRISNLRDVTHVENMQNIDYKKKSLTGYYGVIIDSRVFKNNKQANTNKLYLAYNGRNKIGIFESATIAAVERDKFILKNSINRPLNFPLLIKEYHNEIR